MRTLQLLTLALLATVANADTFNLTFNPILTFRLFDEIPVEHIFSAGRIVTDGTCTDCSISQFPDIVRDGIEFVNANYFVLGDPNEFGVFFGRAEFNTITGDLTGIIDTGGDVLIEFGGHPEGFLCPHHIDPTGTMEIPFGTCPSGP